MFPFNHLCYSFMEMWRPIAHPHIDRRINAPLPQSGSKRVCLLKCQFVKGRKSAEFDIVARNLFHTRSVRWRISDNALDETVCLPRAWIVPLAATGGWSPEPDKQNAVVCALPRIPLRVCILLQQYSPPNFALLSQFSQNASRFQTVYPGRVHGLD
jgi:hypothetical protein